MAFSLSLFGLKPYRKLGGRPYNGAFNVYTVSNGYDANIFSGDVVHMSSGYIRVVSVTTDRAMGVFVGCRYVDSTTKRPTWSNYFPANTSSYIGKVEAFVVDDPDMVYLAQADASVTLGEPMAFNYDLTLGAGSTTTGISGFGVKAASRQAATAMLRILGPSKHSGNALGDATPWLEVVLVQHHLARASAT